MSIQILSAEMASQIAAGEVVERPASVVKELVENALDAGATRIDIESRGGGAELIRVVDDGHGIPEAELEIACARHGTSKIQSVDDLFRIATLGFRGEALPSIAAVSRFELASRTADQSVGALIGVDGGQVVDRGKRALQRGAAVTVRDLFHNVPARRKYLKGASAETAAITTLVTTFAIAHPMVAFRLAIDGAVTFSSSGRGDELEAMGRVFGAAAVNAMVELAPSARWRGVSESYAPAIAGWIGLPPLSRGNRAGMLLFVNGRAVASRSLNFAIAEAYHSLLPDGRFPIVVLRIALPPEEVDVNVHPTKAEVKFLRDRLVFATVQRAVRATLADHVAIPHVTGLPDPPQPSANGSATFHDWLAESANQTAPSQTATNGHSPDRTTELGAEWPTVAPPRTTVASDAPKSPRLPPLRVLGQMQNLFVLAEGPDGLYLIDQHAAHERITYDRLARERRAGAVTSQMLLEPIAIELSPRARIGLDERVCQYRDWGFQVDPFGPNTLLVRGVPATLRAPDMGQAIAEIIEETADEPARADWDERLLRSLACRGSVRGGQALSPAEQRELIAQLERADLPHTCPHGRPVIVLLTQAQLARQFGR